MARSPLRCLLMQLSPLTHTSLEAFSLQPCLRFRCSALTGGCDGHRLRFAQASPLASRLANLKHRIEFTSVWDCSFAPGCFPPRLAATQLPFASPPVPGSVAIRFSLIGLYVVMVTLDAARGGVESEYFIEFQQRFLGHGCFAHVQGSPVFLLEGGGYALLDCE